MGLGSNFGHEVWLARLGQPFAGLDFLESRELRANSCSGNREEGEREKYCYDKMI